MKKIALVLTLALPFVFASCGDDDDVKNIELDNQTLSIDYSQVKSVGSNEKNCTYVSNNTFVATVDESGNVTGVHEGEAVITVTKEGFNPAQCVVTVKATNNNFELPILEWNASVNEVKKMYEGSSYNLLDDDTSAGILTYGKSLEEYPWYQYSFNTDKLDASSLVMDMDMSANEGVYEFLSQRYKESAETENGFIFIDADNKTSANLQVTLVLDTENDLVSAVWQPMDHVTKSGYSADVVNKLHNHAKALRK